MRLGVGLVFGFVLFGRKFRKRILVFSEFRKSKNKEEENL